MNIPGTSTGHGHVWPRPDGMKAKCGGPAICAECRKDAAQQDAPTDADIERLSEDYEDGIGVGIPHSQVVKFARALLARYAPAQDAEQARDAELSPDDLELFASTYEHFDDGVDTTTGTADLMRFVRMGLLECTQYEVTEKGDSVYAARALKSTSAGKGE